MNGRPIRSRVGTRFAVSMGAWVVACAACNHGGSPAPQVGGLEVVVESDMSIPRDIDHVSLQATQGGRSILQVENDLGPGALLIPTAFEIKSTGSSGPVTIKAVAYQKGEARVERDVVTPIPDGREGEIRLALNYLCVGTAQTAADGSVVSTCPGGLTCVQGACKTSTVPPASVPTYEPGIVAGGGGAGGANAAAVSVDGGTSGGCFDVQDCFAGATAVAVDETSCTITLPAGMGSAADVNVALQFPAGSSGVCGANACWVVFDQGDDWTASGGTLQLPIGACTSPAAQGATVVVTTACVAKTHAQPNCGPWSSAMTPAIEPTMIPSPVGQSCTGPSSQSCGLCGVQTRTCTNGTWSAWGACGGEGTCQPSATQVCGANGVQTCGDDCQWAACGCAGGQSSCGGTCVSLESDVHNCGGCGNDCTLLPRVASDGIACTAGRCTYACDPGYADCGNGGTGCTATLMTTTNCGACGAACKASAPMCAPVSGAGGAGGVGGSGVGAAYACATGCSGAAPTLCSGSCVSLTSSNENCGACGKVCAGGMMCQNGTCACRAGTQPCNGVCVNEQSDNANCGACGNACPSGSTCQNDVCICGGPGTQACGNCGTETRTCVGGAWSAWSACAGGGICAPGTTQGCTNGTQTCGTGCAWGTCHCSTAYTLCGNQCVNEKSDNANCGACGHACPTGSMCQNGACTCSGAASQACGNCGMQARSCNDGTWSAWSACAGQGTCAVGATQVCGTIGTQTCGSTCQWGMCGCPTGDTLCNGQCVNEQTDSSNCGACGTVCPVGKSCQAGSCGCATGATLCQGACVNEQTDSANCGGCGSLYACATGKTCQGGACKCAPGTQDCAGTCMAKCPAPTSTCFDPNTGLTWGSTGSGVVNDAQASTTCSSYGSNWHVPNFNEIHKWPWVSPGQLQTTPSAGTTCVLSFAIKQPDNGADPGANEDFVWVSDLCNGGVHGGPSTCGTNTFCQGDLVTGQVPLVSCPGDANAIALCVH